MRMYNPPHPGRIIKEALENIPMSVTAFAAHIGVSRVNLSRVINCRAGVTPEMSIKLSQVFGQGQGDIWSRSKTTTTSGKPPKPNAKRSAPSRSKWPKPPEISERAYCATALSFAASGRALCRARSHCSYSACIVSPARAIPGPRCARYSRHAA